MSIVSMVDAKLLREQPNPPPAAAPPAGPAPAGVPPSPVGVPTNMINQLTRFIPTETIVLYVAYLAALGALIVPPGQDSCQASFTGRWTGVIAFAAASALLALGLTYGKGLRAGQPFKWPIFEMIVAPIAFCAWAFSLPDTPFMDICSYSTAWGAFIVLATTVSIAVVAWVLNKAPDYEKILTG